MSNPLRQSLYTLDDCLNGGEFKAKAAVKSLKQIFPAVVIGLTTDLYMNRNCNKLNLHIHTLPPVLPSFPRKQKLL